MGNAYFNIKFDSKHPALGGDVFPNKSSSPGVGFLLLRNLTNEKE